MVKARKSTLAHDFFNDRPIQIAPVVGSHGPRCRYGQGQAPQHAQPVLKCHGNGIEKPQSQKCESLKGMDPAFLRNTHLQLEEPGEDAGQQCPNRSSPRSQKGSNRKLSQLAYIAHFKLEKHAHAA